MLKTRFLMGVASLFLCGCAGVGVVATSDPNTKLEDARYLYNNSGSSWKSVGKSACHSDFWQHAGKNFQSQVLLVAQSVCATLDDANLVVESLDETE